MSGLEARVIEVVFGLAVGVMLVAAGVRAWLARAGGELAVVRGRVNPPGLHAIDWFGVMMLAGLYFGFHLMSLQPAAGDGGGRLGVAALVMSIVAQLMMVGVVVAIVLPRGGVARFFGLRWAAWPWVLLIAPMAVVAVWVMIGGLELAGYSRWMAEWFGGPELQESVVLLRESRDPAVLGLMAFAAVLVAPLCEEFIFRGYLYPVVKRFGGGGAAAVASALLFAAAHNHVQTLLPLFLLGLVLVRVYELTGSIWAPVGVHLCFNATTVGLTMLARVLGVPLEAGS